MSLQIFGGIGSIRLESRKNSLRLENNIRTCYTIKESITNQLRICGMQQYFISRDMGYCFNNFVGYWIFRMNSYGEICQFIRDTCLFTGFLVTPLYKPHLYKIICLSLRQIAIFYHKKPKPFIGPLYYSL